MSDFPPRNRLSRTTTLAVAGLGVTQIVGWGSTYYLLTLLGGPIAADLGFNPALVAAGLSIMLVLGAVLGPVAGRAMDTRGARPMMALGSLLAAAGLLALSQAAGVLSYLGAWLVIGLAAPLILYPAAFTALTQVAPGEARQSITWLTLPGGLASTVFWPLTHWLLNIWHWRTICLAYALIHLLVCLPLHLAVIRRASAEVVAAAEAAHKAIGLPVAARRRAALLFAAALAFNSLLVTGLLNQFVTVMHAIGQPAQWVVTLGMTFGIAQTSARIIDLITGARLDALRLGVAVAAGFPLAYGLLLIAPGAAVAGFGFAVLLGMSNGVWTIVRGAVVLRLFGVAGYGENLGTVIVAQGLAAAAAPMVFAALVDTLGAYAALAFSTVVALMGLVAMVALLRHAGASELAARDQG